MKVTYFCQNLSGLPTSLINVDSITELINFYRAGSNSASSLPVELLYYFGFLQLIRIDNSLIGTYGGGQPRYHKNSLGEKFVEILTVGIKPNLGR